MNHNIIYKMNYTQYRDNTEIERVLKVIKKMWEANNHLSLCALIDAISIHKGLAAKRITDQQLVDYITTHLE
tara:strand:- start:1084 stop:1299 length:216 start_codon:yes stop_codon:yes gene_type:complete